MTPIEQFEQLVRYLNSFDSFLSDHFGITTSTNFDAPQVDHVGLEEIVIAHICWKLLFTRDQTFMIVAANRNISRDWRDKVINAISALPDYLKWGIKRSTLQEMVMENGSRAYFHACDRNTGRGMTIQGLYIVEHAKINSKLYHDFLISILPALASVKGRQIVHYSRTK